MAIRFHFEGQTAAVPSVGERTVLELARDAGRPVDAKCGGRGSCGRCHVLLGEGEYRIFNESIRVAPGHRREALACRTVVLSASAEIFLPYASQISFEGTRIADGMELPEHRYNPRFSQGYGLAADIGTTTVVAALIDLSTGSVLGRDALYNQQILRADDVISRIALCSDPGGLQTLQDLIIKHTLNPLIRRLCADAAVDSSNIVHIAASGNTVMMHLFFGISPLSIGVLPFKPASRTFTSTAGELGIDGPPDAVVDAVPAISGFVGGDITADLYVSSLRLHPETDPSRLSILIDIGTNGEIVASAGGKMTACAAAAGPAFEGAGLLHGVRAASGAIEHIRFDERLHFELNVIGPSTPVGLCGSAIIDFMAEGFRCGLISSMGRFDTKRLKSRGRYDALCGMHACVLVPAEESATGEPICITEGDIAEILKAKAAIYGGLKSLLTELDRSVQEIDRIILAGGFAQHIDLANAMTIGLLPELPPARYAVIGNGSLAGASLMLLDQSTMQAFLELSDRPRIVTLNETGHFIHHFHDALALPHLDPDEFRSVQATQAAS